MNQIQGIKDRRLRVLWSSNAVWASSGYSVQSRDLLYRFLDDGWQMAMSAFYGLEGGMIEVNGLKCYPKMGHAWGEDACFYHQQDFKADCVITFQNCWILDPNIMFRLKNWIPYVPIEFNPPALPEIQRLKHAYRVISLSRYGQKALEKVGIQSKLILEAVDTKVFSPLDQKEIRKQIGLPQDIFLFGMVAANKDNPPRKSFQHVLDAFAKFVKVHPDSGLYFHVLLQQHGGFPIQDYANHLKINDKIYFTPPYDLLYKSPHPVINRIINTFDVLLNPSSGEGFGLPIIEAQAAGVPVIVNNWTAMPELVVEGKTGEICKHSMPRWTNLFAFAAEPSLKSLYEKMEKIYKYARDEQTKKACRQHILDNYDMEDRVKNVWIPFLEQLQNELLGELKEVGKNGTNN